jgi:hypothetical protein
VDKPFRPPKPLSSHRPPETPAKPAGGSNGYDGPGDRYDKGGGGYDKGSGGYDKSNDGYDKSGGYDKGRQYDGPTGEKR